MTIKPSPAAVLLLLLIGFSYWHFWGDLALDPVTLVLPALAALWVIFMVPGTLVAGLALYLWGIAPPDAPMTFMAVMIPVSTAFWGWQAWRMWRDWRRPGIRLWVSE